LRVTPGAYPNVGSGPAVHELHCLGDSKLKESNVTDLTKVLVASGNGFLQSVEVSILKNFFFFITDAADKKASLFLSQERLLLRPYV
jgi:hypothetical protein